jgi:hypothetical protein
MTTKTISVFQRDKNDVIWNVRCHDPIFDCEFGAYEQALDFAKARGREIGAELVIYPRGQSHPEVRRPGKY